MSSPGGEGGGSTLAAAAEEEEEEEARHISERKARKQPRFLIGRTRFGSIFGTSRPSSSTGDFAQPGHRTKLTLVRGRSSVNFPSFGPPGSSRSHTAACRTLVRAAATSASSLV